MDIFCLQDDFTEETMMELKVLVNIIPIIKYFSYGHCWLNKASGCEGAYTEKKNPKVAAAYFVPN